MKSSLLAVSVLLVAGLATACGSGDQNGANNGGKGGADGNGTGGGGSSAGGNDTGGGNSGGATGGTNSGGTNTGGANTGGTNTGGSNVCGGKSGGTCGADELCDYPDNQCGVTDGQGECKPKPDAQSCPDTVNQQVCACDGTVYSNTCQAEAAGLDVQSLGYCPPLEGKFPCGEIFCEDGAEYCQKQLSDVVGEPHSYSCMLLPATCPTGSPTCACMAGVACSENCELKDGSIFLTCPGG